MTPTEFKFAREDAGLSLAELAAFLKLGKDGKRMIMRWEEEKTLPNGKANPPPPLACLILHWVAYDGQRPPGLPARFYQD